MHSSTSLQVKPAHICCGIPCQTLLQTFPTNIGQHAHRWHPNNHGSCTECHLAESCRHGLLQSSLTPNVVTHQHLSHTHTRGTHCKPCLQDRHRVSHTGRQQISVHNAYVTEHTDEHYSAPNTYVAEHQPAAVTYHMAAPRTKPWFETSCPGTSDQHAATRRVGQAQVELNSV